MYLKSIFSVLAPGSLRNFIFHPSCLPYVCIDAIEYAAIKGRAFAGRKKKAQQESKSLIRSKKQMEMDIKCRREDYEKRKLSIQ